MMTGFRKGLVVLGMFLAWGNREASAEMVIYHWGPVTGWAYGWVAPDYHSVSFTTTNGELTIGYDPDNASSSYIDLSTGGAGYELVSDAQFTASGGYFSAMYGRGGWIYVSFYGDPGPVNMAGHPESLYPLVGASAIVWTTAAGQGVELNFNGSVAAGVAPEPSALVMQALGLGAVSLAGLAARRRRRQGSGRSGGR